MPESAFSRGSGLLPSPREAAGRVDHLSGAKMIGVGGQT
jgi:hypothetical protein